MWKHFRSSPGLTATHFLLGVFIIWLLMDVFRHLLPAYLPFVYLLIHQKQVVFIIASAFISAAAVAARYTVVRVSDDTIQVRRLCRRYGYRLEEFEIGQVSKRNNSVSVLAPLYKHDLVAENKSGKKQTVRLHFFSVRTLDALMNHFLTVQVKKHDELAAKNRTFREKFYAEGIYPLNREDILKKNGEVSGTFRFCGSFWQ